ncbi:Alkaline phosphatase [Trinorchestia longiramus]|nr:Alkaline phosphatase [Trinorchestia longiramus]
MHVAGIVTSTRMTHATPAATYSHVANRRWECNRDVGMEGHGCPDIAEQLVHHNPGKNIKVILGGGRQPFGATLGIPDEFTCNRTDNRDLTREWLKSKQDAGLRARYLTSATELRGLDHSKVDYLMGLFADSHIPFVEDQVAASSNSPSLSEMATAAVKQLQKDDNGFFLLVEGGRIDHAYHNNLPKKALEETLAFDEAIAAVLKQVDLDETLVVVTADHSHVLTMNGYPNRGNDILGLADVSDVDGLPYTTLMFTNGPGFNITSNGSNVTRADPREYPLQNGEHMSPMSHLFHRLHEQHYIAHVMAYAACIGPSAGESCRRPSFASNSIDDDDAFSLPHSPLRKATSGFQNVKSTVDSAAEAAKVASSAGIKMPSSSGTASSSSNSIKTGSKSPTRGQSSSSSSSSSRFGPSSSSASSSSSSRPQNVLIFPGASTGFTSPKFPTLSPTLQSLLDQSQQNLINALGLERIKQTKTFSSLQDVTNLLGRPAFDAPAHDME